ncbi:MAG: hypothetical protein WB714_18730, partial [Candidatus Sulfotelmatobacter sp.]
SSYGSADGVNWTQVGSSQTISMAPTVYVGLAVVSGNASSLATTATFDSVSISSNAAADGGSTMPTALVQRLPGSHPGLFEPPNFLE